MTFLPTQVLRKKHYAVYKEASGEVKTKAKLLKEALNVALKKGKHEKWIDFIPARFTLQLHGWISEDSDMKKLNDVQNVIQKALKTGKDPLKEIDSHKAKTHYDLRIQKATAPTWFGLTCFRAPWLGTILNKVMGTVKGYQSIVSGGKKLSKFLLEKAQKEMVKEGISERQDRTEWMKIKAQWFKPNSPGNPTKKLSAFMIAIEYYKPACLHRRELDFVDCTFFGNHLEGRYYNRLVEREVKGDQLMEWQKVAIKKGITKKFYNLSFYFWKAKDQWGSAKTVYSMEDVKEAALGKKTLNKIPAPSSK